MQEQIFSISKELSQADFGDKRLSSRLERLADSVSARPDESLPEATGSVAALEATYRFLGNPKITPDKILSPHIDATIERSCRSKGRVLVAHDTTTFTFSGESRAHLGWITSGGRGFLAHFSLAISRSQVVQPLGVLGIAPFFRSGKPRGRDPERGKKSYRDFESRRWWKSVEATEMLFPSDLHPIHVMDREADDYALFSELRTNNVRFVIRIRHNRANCQIAGESEGRSLFEFLEDQKVVCEREVGISKRNEPEIYTGKKGYHPRGARIAKLHITATKVELGRTCYQRSDLPASLMVNCVHVYEVDAPQNTEPVDWKLFTSEPINSAQDVLNIVDDYRARWMIEEYFKALKTGCAYEKRQLENKTSLLNALAVFAPIAWQLLLLRAWNRQNPQLPATHALTKTQIEVLKATSKKPLPDELDIHQAVLAVAALGGHIPNNGQPGWQVLARGMEKLLTMEIAWIAAKGRCDQS